LGVQLPDKGKVLWICNTAHKRIPLNNQGNDLVLPGLNFLYDKSKFCSSILVKNNIADGAKRNMEQIKTICYSNFLEIIPSSNDALPAASGRGIGLNTAPQGAGY